MNEKRKHSRAFTFIELLTILAIVMLLAALLLPSLQRAKARAQIKQCVSHLKQIGLAFKTWSLDSSDHYPLQVDYGTNGPPNQAQLMQTIPMAVYTYQVFGVMSNELSTPRVLVCPSDDSPWHTNFFMVRDGTSNQPYAGQTTLCNLNISYFAGRDAVENNPQMLLAGDRNLYGGGSIPNSRYDPAANGGFGNSPIHARTNFSPGFACALGTNCRSTDASPCWTDKIHRKQGNVALADGSVQQLSNSRLRAQLAHSDDANSNVLLFP